MTKDKVLALLKNQTDYLSGAWISEQIGVSRMAVSSAVKASGRKATTSPPLPTEAICLKMHPTY